ncbi:FR47-like protein [Algoriphagus aquaeductus]|uniref:FR47-like protein n=1 Tax=Algoriphagus aquaeductus TaxID=475299 RepID=A0A326RJB6_9BACT|nr:GNAT family N-acetyltransferase [Algoriphagus aquaeductus]PZV77166.1 FR47-like protein [Algoriphagus aquaeductus]
MPHPLDNPIWNALNTGSQILSFGTDRVRLINQDMGFFAGMPAYEPENLDELYDFLEPGQRVILFPPGHLVLDEKWAVHNDHELLQMVCERDFSQIEPNSQIHHLNESHIPEMLALTQLTKPGPFLSKTIDFGDYFGFFSNGKLVSMAGSRLSPSPFTEVSAVCTHPDFAGQGISRKVMPFILQRIQQRGKTPFLHLYPDNTPALRLYSSLGFVSRAMLRVYLLEKVG